MIRNFTIFILPFPPGDDCMDAGGRAVPGAVAEGWGEGGRFTAEQMKWLEMIRDHIAANLSIAPDDFDKFDRIEFGRTLVRRAAVSARDGASQYAPFSQQGGLGKVHQLFGDKLNSIIEELNETLAA